MPRHCHDIKYLTLTPVFNGSTLTWQGKNLSGTLEEVQTAYETTLREQLHFGSGVKCEITPLVGYYTIDPSVKYSREDYKWNPVTNVFSGPSFNESGSLQELLPKVQSFLKTQTHRTVNPAMSLMFVFYSGEHDTYVPTPAPAPAPVPAPAPAPTPARKDSIDSVGLSANIFGDDDDF